MACRVLSSRDKLKDHYEDVRKALTRLGDSRSSSVSMCQLQKALQEGGCPLKDEELTELLGRFAFLS